MRYPLNLVGAVFNYFLELCAPGIGIACSNITQYYILMPRLNLYKHHTRRSATVMTCRTRRNYFHWYSKRNDAVRATNGENRPKTSSSRKIGVQSVRVSDPVVVPGGVTMDYTK